MADTLCRYCHMAILDHGPSCKNSKGEPMEELMVGVKERERKRKAMLAKRSRNQFKKGNRNGMDK
ncbi:MAG: hypothetical protein ACTSW1_07585 [Candidatus Hodarchaeales archaeon]